MRIAFISTILNHPWGGADTLWTSASEAAAERGDALLLCISRLTAGHPRIQTLVSKGAEFLLMEDTPARRSISRRLIEKAGLKPSTDSLALRRLRAFRPDLVVISQGGTYDLVLHPDWVDWLESSGTRFRVIANWQKEHPDCGRGEFAFLERIFDAADAVHFVSNLNLEATRRHLLGPLPGASVLHNPLRWQPADLRAWPSDGQTRMATVSRLDAGKGIQLLLHALAISPPEGDWLLNVYGHGPHEEHLRSLAGYLHLGDRVQFKGHVADLAGIWSENHLLVSPSLEDGVPMTIPEALLCERPVLATRVGGAPDWIDDGETGFICPAPTLLLLVETFAKAMAGRTRWRDMGLLGSRRAIARYRPLDYLRLIT